jgi:hypothetical protein
MCVCMYVCFFGHFDNHNNKPYFIAGTLINYISWFQFAIIREPSGHRFFFFCIFWFPNFVGYPNGY